MGTQQVYVVKDVEDSVCYRDGKMITNDFIAGRMIPSARSGKQEAFTIIVQSGGNLSGARTLVGADKDKAGLYVLNIDTEKKKLGMAGVYTYGVGGGRAIRSKKV